LGQVIAVRTQVVVYHIEDDRQTSAVAGVNQRLQPIRSTVGIVGGEEVHSVIAPATLARKLDDRHQLEVRDPQIDQVVQTLDG
jgi:hypothetical protein